MDSPEFKDIVCRICLDENVIMHWDNTLQEYDDVTYKDCYYKYTQLQCFDDDPFSSMLCRTCSNDLQNVHSLILKALDSHNFFSEVNYTQPETDSGYSIISEDATFKTGFEILLVEKSDAESNWQNHFECENFENDSISETYGNQNDSEEMYTVDSITIEPYSEELNIDNSLSQDLYEDGALQSQNVKGKKLKYDSELYNTVQENSKNEDNSTYNKIEDSIKKTKILHNKYSLQKHEKIHMENRERNATCPVCGVKFFEESHVRLHIRIHDENRKKTYKCEFCDKPFYAKGVLNVHRRVHLGLMTPCPICSKEFYGKIDLEIHMNSHAITPINSFTRKKTRYWVRCNYCDKVIRSTSYKSHTAAHLNKPLMKCSICDKEFFSRESCTEHMKIRHQKSCEEYNDFIILYNKSRLSHLYLAQTTEIKANNDL